MLKVLYAGSPAASAMTLNALINSTRAESKKTFEIVGVLTNPPSAQGRHKTPVPTPVEKLAQEHGIPVFNPEHLDGDCRAKISNVNPDILVCFAYGRIFGPKFMELFRFGGINLHPSRLPEYRGCTPVNAAILNLDEKTSFSIQKVSAKMDEGNILAQEEISLTKKETAGSLLTSAAEWGGKAIEKLLQEIAEKNAVPNGTEQTGKASYTGIIKKEDAKIDWNCSAKKIDAIVRAYNPDPVAWTTESNAPLKIISGVPLYDGQNFNGAEFLKRAHSPGTVVAFEKTRGIIVSCGEGFFAVTELQRQGKNPMDYKSFMNGARDFVGTVLGS